jgi:hypothetical protein
MVRRETYIALRARREAMQIAQDVAHPHLDMPPTWQLPAVPVDAENLPDARYVLPPWWDDGQLYYMPDSSVIRPAPAEVAPTWMKWLAVVCATAILVAAYVLIAVFH